MKMIRTTVTFDRTVSVVVYAPEGTTPEQLKEIGERLAEDGLDGWDPPPWVSFVGHCEAVEVPVRERTLRPPNQYGFQRVVEGSRLGRDETLVLSDAGDDLVCAEDARWWVAEDGR